MTKKYLVISIFLLLLLALSYGISRKIKPTPQTKPPTPPEQNQQSSPSGKTSEPKPAIPEGWKVYENKKFGFRVGYPSDWFGDGSETGLSISTVEEIGPMLSGMGDTDAWVIINARDFPFETMEEAKKNHSGLIIWDEYDTRAEYVKETTFLGFFAIERMGKPIPLSEPGYSLEINFIKNKTLYTFSLFSLTKEGLKLHEPIFRKMLETFSFI